MSDKLLGEIGRDEGPSVLAIAATLIEWLAAVVVMTLLIVPIMAWWLR